jgi:hypothetical protein
VSARVKGADVFINCPFDTGYQPIFSVIVFAVCDLGFVARCSLEDDHAGKVRLSKIQRVIEVIDVFVIDHVEKTLAPN